MKIDQCLCCGAAVVEKKGRGRPKANGAPAEAKTDAKKRGRLPAAKAAPKESAKSSDDEAAPVAKRGRGRPKGTKKIGVPVPIGRCRRMAMCGSPPGRGRGRPRKDAPPPKKDAASTDEDEGSDQ